MSLTIRVMPGDRTGCGLYRLLEPCRVIEASTADVDIQYVFQDEDEGALEVTLRGRLGDVHVIGVKDPECDILVMQRPAHRQLVEAIPFIQAYGTAVVCEYDDDFDTIDPKNPAWRAYEPGLSPEINKLWAKLGSQLADLVTVSTPALIKRYGSHGRVVELPNYVPASYLDVKRRADDELIDKVRIGWAGNPQTHPGDLAVMGRAIPKILAWDKTLFRGIGHSSILTEVGLDRGGHPYLGSYRCQEDIADVVPWAPIDGFATEMAALDIGVVPLKDTTFNRAKSWIKGLEFAALGVAFVASPVQQYKALARLGAGDLVSSTTPSTSPWVNQLRRLVENDEYRKLRAEEGRIVAAGLTYEQHAEKWLQAWSNALSLRRAV